MYSTKKGLCALSLLVVLSLAGSASALTTRTYVFHIGVSGAPGG